LLFGLSLCLPPVREFRNYNILILFFITILPVVFKNYLAYPIDLIHITAGCLLYYAIVRSVKDMRGILKTFAIICFINIPILILQFFGLGIVYLPLHYVGLMGRAYHLGYLAVIMTPFLFEHGKKGYLLSVLFVLTAFLIKSMAINVSLAAGLIGYMFFKFNKKTVVISSIVLIMGTMSYYLIFDRAYFKNKFDEPRRKSAYSYLIKESFMNPIIGNGPGSLDNDAKFVTRIGTDSDSYIVYSSYNQILRTAYEYAWLPLLALFYGAYRYFRKIWIAEPCFMGAFAAMFAYPMFHEALRFARLLAIIIPIIALYEAYCLDKRKERLCQ